MKYRILFLCDVVVSILCFVIGLLFVFHETMDIKYKVVFSLLFCIMGLSLLIPRDSNYQGHREDIRTDSNECKETEPSMIEESPFTSLNDSLPTLQDQSYQIVEVVDTYQDIQPPIEERNSLKSICPWCHQGFLNLNVHKRFCKSKPTSDQQ